MTFFNLFACCLLNKGKTRSLICDTQRNIYFLIPNSLYDLLINDFPKFDLNYIYELYESEKSVIDEYIDFLLKNEIGFLDDRIYKELIPIDLKYDVPESITSLILDLSKDSSYISNSTIASSINHFRIEHLQIRCFYEISIEILKSFLEDISKSTLRSIELIYPFVNEVKSRQIFKKIIVTNSKLLNIIFTGSPTTNLEIYKNREIIYSKDKVIKETNCGIVKSCYFNTNLATYTISSNFNSCLYKKMSIDSKGYIRNCPSMPQSFGNIKDNTMEDALNHKDFKKYWNLTKDKIEVCKDCEFRYICTDCRAYTERTHTNEEGLDTSKPLKCGYDPYTGEWEEWSTNPLKQKAINFYGMQDLA